VREIRVPREHFFQRYPDRVHDLEYAYAVPVNDLENLYLGEAVFGIGVHVLLAEFNLDDPANTNQTIDFETFRRRERGSTRTYPFQVNSPAWVDPIGRLITGTYDARPLLNGQERSHLCSWDRILECEYKPLQNIEVVHPTGVSFSPDNATMYMVDSGLRNLLEMEYSISNGYVNTILNTTSFTDLLEGDTESRPTGLATDENGHLWIGVTGKENGLLMELDPATNTVISKIDIPAQPEIVDIAFAGESFEYLYILTTKNLLKIKDLGVKGLKVPDFELVEYE